MYRLLTPTYQAYFQQNQLDRFDALWSLSLTPVDAPNLERGGYSEVSRITLSTNSLPSRTFFIKRQTNHIGRSLQRPLGEPTFAREVRNIRAFQRMGIPALESVYYEERRQPGRWQAILVTPALEGYTDMIAHNAQWSATDPTTREALIAACGHLLRTLHRRRWRHGSLYAKHVFLRPDANARHGFDAKFIDLEKSRPLVNAGHEKRRDLTLFVRRLTQWQRDDYRRLLSHYLETSADSPIVDRWLSRLDLPDG